LVCSSSNHTSVICDYVFDEYMLFVEKIRSFQGALMPRLGKHIRNVRVEIRWEYLKFKISKISEISPTK